MTLISKTSFDLLDQLARNNTKDWYDAHKADIKTHCLAPFGEMLEHVSNRLMDSDRPLEGSAKRYCQTKTKLETGRAVS